MSFLNLGSFGEGFVTGFATEANKALKESVNRINTRVDKLKDFQVQRAIKDQDRRREEIEENKEALERAYAVLGGDADAERAIAYAGGLLKERGSVAAFNKRIDELQAAKDSGYDIMSYFDRASFDAPAGTLDDYAVAAAGAPQTFATDYRIPEGMDTGTGRTLVGTILGKDIDIVGRAMQEAGEEVRALYGADVTTLAQLPTITFKAEEFSLRDKSPSERLQYAIEKLALPNVQKDDALTEKYTKMRNDQEQAVLNTKVEEDMKRVLEDRLARTPAGSDAARDIQDQLKAVNRSIKIKAAETSDDAFAGIDLEIEFALNDMMDAYEKTGTIDRTEVDRLEKRKLELTGKPGKTVGEEIAEEREELNRQVDRKLITPEQFAAKVAILNQRAAIIEKNKPKGATSAAKMNSWSSIFVRAIETEEKNVLQGFDQTERDAHARIAELIKGGGAGQEARLRSTEEEADAMAIYDRIEAAKRNVSKKVVEDQLSVLDPALDVEAFLAAVPFGVAPVASTDSPAPAASAQTASAQTASALGGETPAADTSTAAEGDGLASIRLKIKNDKAGVDKFITLGLNNNTSSAEMYDRALKLHGADFAEKVREIYVPVAQDEGEIPEGEEAEIAKLYASPQQESALESIRGMPFLQRASENLQIKTVSSDLNITEAEAKKIIDSLSNVKFSRKQQLRQARNIVETMLGTNYKEVREIAKQLNVPMEYARRLHKEVSTDKKAAGGLMSRK